MWVSVTQMVISLFALVVALAVYTIHADKLFLDMREERIKVWQDYLEARNARHAFCLETIHGAYNQAADAELKRNQKLVGWI